MKFEEESRPIKEQQIIKKLDQYYSRTKWALDKQFKSEMENIALQAYKDVLTMALMARENNVEYDLDILCKISLDYLAPNFLALKESLQKTITICRSYLPAKFHDPQSDEYKVYHEYKSEKSRSRNERNGPNLFDIFAIKFNEIFNAIHKDITSDDNPNSIFKKIDARLLDFNSFLKANNIEPQNLVANNLDCEDLLIDMMMPGSTSRTDTRDIKKLQDYAKPAKKRRLGYKNNRL